MSNQPAEADGKILRCISFEVVAARISIGPQLSRPVRPKDMNVNVRDATIDDLDVLVALNDEVHDIHVSLFPSIFRDTEKPALRKWFEDQMGDPLVSILIAESDAEVAGYLVVRLSNRDAHLFCHAHSCAYVDQIGVTVDFRKQGVGRALLDEAARRAKEQGMSRLELDVWSDNRAAKSAFDALGFKTYNEKMFMEI